VSCADERSNRHGRDNNLHVWQIRPEDEANFSTVLPIEDAESQRPAPWLLHSLPVNTLNFCSFAMCHTPGATSPEILIATPGLQDGMINIISLPAEDRVATIPPPKDLHTGMLMAVAIDHVQGELVVLAGYETGHVARWQQNSSKHWSCTYLEKPHSQPVLSLSLSPMLGFGFSSSADAIVARHPLADTSGETKTVQTKHAGQQSLTLRSDGKIFATAGWDDRVRVYSAKTMKELAVLKWHKEGVYAVAFAPILGEGSQDEAAGSEAADDGGAEGVRNEMTVSARRTEKAKRTHWLAAGSKDGKVSLWEVY